MTRTRRRLPQTLTVEEAARILRIGRNSAYKAVERGDLPVLRFGRLYRVPRRAIEAMLGRASNG